MTIQVKNIDKSVEVLLNNCSVAIEEAVDKNKPLAFFDETFEYYNNLLKLLVPNTGETLSKFREISYKIFDLTIGRKYHEYIEIYD